MRRLAPAIGVVLVFAATGACRSPARTDAPPAASSSPGTTAATAAATQVLLFADLGEADEACTCGKLIRAVRAAAARGVKTREVDSGDEGQSTKVSHQYRILVAPAVLFLDDGGREVRRFEGESTGTLEGVTATLDRMGKRS